MKNLNRGKEIPNRFQSPRKEENQVDRIQVTSELNEQTTRPICDRRANDPIHYSMSVITRIQLWPTLRPTLCFSMAKSGIRIAAVLMLLIASPFALQAAEDDQTADQEGESWHVNADSIQYDQAADEYVASGNVRVSREGRTLTADMVRLNQKSRHAWAEGNVRLMSGQDLLTGQKIELNLDTEIGSIYEGRLFFSENHLYLTGREISKTGPSTYHIIDADATTCDGDRPDWHITAKDLEVTIEGYAFAKHTAFWARRMPVLYSPYFIFPVKLKRQSGLLAPEFELSDRKGAAYLQPLFWAINDSMDATFFAHYMAKRGTRLGGEFRYAAGERARGTFMADGFDDRKIDDGQGNNSDNWGYTDDDYLRPNSDRYWFRAKIDQNLPLGVTAKLDLDVVSDQDYLKEFQDGYNGFEETRDHFRDTFSRDIDDYNDPIRRNQLNLNRLWNGYTLNMDARWYDDVIKRRQDGTKDTLQNLPQVTLDGTKKKIGGLPLYFDLLSSYTHFYREEGTRGHRADLYPRLYYPMRLLGAVNIEPSAGLRQTVWHIDQYETPPGDGEKDFYRAIYDLKLDTSTDAYRVFSINTAGCDKLKHGLTPRIIYTYTPEKNQEEYPEFDSVDRIESANLITYSLTNTLVARKPKTGAEESRGPVNDYIPFLRFKLEESFDIDKHKDGQPRPFSDILGELDITPGRYILLDADTLWRPYDSRFYGFNAGLKLWDNRGDRIRAEYRFTREEPADAAQGTSAVTGVESINLNGSFAVIPNWQLRGRYEHNLEENRLIEIGGGISYRSQCWGVDVDYSVEEEEGGQNRSVSVMVYLTGLGSFGSK